MASESRWVETPSLGFFWGDPSLPFDDDVDPERGYLRADGQVADLEVLVEDVMETPAGRDQTPPRVIVGILPETAVLLPEIVGFGYTNRWGGPRASSRRYRARTVIDGVPIDRLKSLRPLDLSAHFHGVGKWAGITSAKETKERANDGRLTSWSVELRSGPEITHPLTGARTLVLGSDWSVTGPSDRRSLSAPVTVGVRSRRPTEAWRLLAPIFHTQNLFNLAFGGFIAASDGRALLSVEPGRLVQEPSCGLWCGPLMVPAAGISAPKSMTEFPLFTLDDLGGLSGLARWIRLSEMHGRATEPVVFPYRYGPTSPRVALMEVAAGIEYWVKSARPAQWAKTKFFVQALAGRIGSHFEEWVGSSQAWGSAFWTAYNDLKHDPNANPDLTLVSDLAASGRLLLAAALLDRVARTKDPSRAIFQSHRTRMLGTGLKESFG